MATDEKWMPEWLEEVRKLKADLAETRRHATVARVRMESVVHEWDEGSGESTMHAVEYMREWLERTK